MEKPSRKLKKTLLILGVTGAVYFSFKYLLPLVIPFLIAYVFALALRPSALWLENKCRFRIKGREFKVALGIIGGIEIVLLMIIFGVVSYIGCRKLCAEFQLLFENLPNMISRLDHWLTGNCFWVEHMLELPEGFMVKTVRDMLTGGVKAVKSSAMPFLMVNSMTLVKYFVEVTVITVILFIATILSLQEMEEIRTRRDKSMFCHEFAMIGNRLMTVGSAWLKTQGIIIMITMLICTIGLFFMKNQYSILLGIGIGILDALPIFGTGTVLIPWAVISLVNKNWMYGFGLFVIYLICYFFRQIMEAKIMSSKVGLTPLEALISMYVGLRLFGLLGFILGPMGLLMIEDIVKLYENP